MTGVDPLTVQPDSAGRAAATSLRGPSVAGTETPGPVPSPGSGILTSPTPTYLVGVVDSGVSSSVPLTQGLSVLSRMDSGPIMTFDRKVGGSREAEK